MIKRIIILLIPSIIILSCSVLMNKESEGIMYHNLDMQLIDTNDYLLRVSPDDPYYEWGSPFAYVNKKGDTIIPFGKYNATCNDTIKTYAILTKDSMGFIGIDRNEKILYKVFYFDNGPDELKEGLFRVIRNGKIGFANEFGEIVIPCQFDCAYYFENGKAKVSLDCNKIKDLDHIRWESDTWFYIDKTSKRIE